jgi:hypothetical protein
MTTRKSSLDRNTLLGFLAMLLWSTTVALARSLTTSMNCLITSVVFFVLRQPVGGRMHWRQRSDLCHSLSQGYGPGLGLGRKKDLSRRPIPLPGLYCRFVFEIEKAVCQGTKVPAPRSTAGRHDPAHGVES